MSNTSNTPRAVLARATAPGLPCRGEVWWVVFDTGLGHEQGGYRPALVLSCDKINQSRAEKLVVAPLTSKGRVFPTLVPLPEGEAGLPRASWVQVDEVRSISSKRLQGRCGAVSDEALRRVEAALLRALGL
jgi:mRNA interferase MazF